MIPPRLRTLFEELSDDDVVRISTLKRLLEQGETSQKWVPFSEALKIINEANANGRVLKAATLRARARQWEHMQSPPITVIRKGAKKGAHYMFDEAGCRNYSTGIRTIQQPPQGDTAVSGDDTSEATVHLWTNRVTRNLSRD